MTNSNFADEYYDAAWSEIALSISPAEEKRINETLALIPQDCSSILDVGCGDGRITNRLVSKYGRVCGLDSSEAALKHVESEKVLSGLDPLPFPDKSFDLVLCCEVLEHLPFETYPVALKELERVSKKYIIVSVPNNQNLRRAGVICPQCGCVFDASRHVRYFNREKLERLFVNFDPDIIKGCGVEKTYPDIVLEAYKLLKSVTHSSFPAVALCPQCGYSLKRDPAKSPSGDKQAMRHELLLRMTRVLRQKQHVAWLLAAYKRR